MPLKLKIYIGVITVSAIALFLYLLPSFPSFSKIWIAFIFFFVISTLAEFLSIDLPIAGGISIGFPIDFLLILIFGPAFAMLITSLGALISEVVERKISWYKVVFNVSQYALSTGIAGIAYKKAGGIVGAQDIFQFILPATICALAYCIVNITLFVLVVSFSQDVKIKTILRKSVKDTVPSYIAEAPMGFVMAIVYMEVGIIGILLFFFPLLLARRSFELFAKMRKVYLDTIRALAAAIDAKDPYTKGHSERVSKNAVALAQEMNLPDREIENIEYSALLHDIGKIGIEDSILGKNDRLTEQEFEKIKKHTIMGANIIEPVDFLKSSYKAIYHHHERYNGNGYPDGIKEEEIPLSARIIAVVDAYDAMGSDRPYRKKLGKDIIIKILKEQSGKQFDPEVVKVFLSIIEGKKEK
ncbi:MAG: HD-GYP domain-containing protein [Candidatus Caldatribacteriota bacterium]|nr:HD-GYP domain-containing protein [Candidatus Caldatribacteriota bacterium]